MPSFPESESKSDGGCPVQAIEFYKAWDRYGALSNFSPHPIEMPENAASQSSQDSLAGGPRRVWQTLEHYYQAQKFAGAAFGSFCNLFKDVKAASACHICQSRMKFGKLHNAS